MTVAPANHSHARVPTISINYSHDNAAPIAPLLTTAYQQTNFSVLGGNEAEKVSSRDFELAVPLLMLHLFCIFYFLYFQ
jgi:hypothetical protein